MLRVRILARVKLSRGVYMHKYWIVKCPKCNKEVTTMANSTPGHLVTLKCDCGNKYIANNSVIKVIVK